MITESDMIGGMERTKQTDCDYRIVYHNHNLFALGNVDDNEE